MEKLFGSGVLYLVRNNDHVKGQQNDCKKMCFQWGSPVVIEPYWHEE
jgi:hypothetical protein